MRVPGNRHQEEQLDVIYQRKLESGRTQESPPTQSQIRPSEDPGETLQVLDQGTAARRAGFLGHLSEHLLNIRI